MADNCTLNIVEELQTLQMVMSVPTFVLGLAVNVAVLATFCCRRAQSWSYMMVYITNMALADCTVLFSLPLKMYSYGNPWPFSTDFCLVMVSVYYVNMYVSIFTATAISVVRYVAIKYPFKAREILSPRKALVVCVLIWVLMCSISSVFHFVDAPEKNKTEFKCFQKIKSEPLPLPFILVLELAGYVLPLITMTFCSTRIIRTLLNQTGASSRSDRQSILIIAANWAVFFICFTPFHIGFLVKYFAQTFRPKDCSLLRGVHNFTHFSFLIANTNCCLDASSYYFAARDSWKRISTCCPSKAGSENAVI